MSAASRQKTCGCCGQIIKEGDSIDIEPLIDPCVRVIIVLSGHSTFTRDQKL